jgi:hypothetical protein
MENVRGIELAKAQLREDCVSGHHRVSSFLCFPIATFNSSFVLFFVDSTKVFGVRYPANSAKKKLLKWTDNELMLEFISRGLTQ